MSNYQGPKPVGYKILVEIPMQPEKSTGGILLSDISRKKDDAGYDVGIVSKLGPSCYTDARMGDAWCKEGDLIYYIRHAGYIFETHDGKKYRFINDEDVRGIADFADLRDYAQEYVTKRNEEVNNV